MRRRDLVLSASAFVAAGGAGPRALLVYAAVSITEVVSEAASRFAGSVQTSFAASSALARQIEAGAPADLFVSADEEWMDYLAARALIQQQTRRVLARNALVLIAPIKAGSSAIDIARRGELKKALAGGRLAIADPTHVPAGRYAAAALRALGVWDEVADRLAPAENVRVALAYVARGEARFGLVYATDAAAEPSIRVIAGIPPESHPPIVYPAALTRRAQATARAFLDHLSGPAGRSLFAARGFLPP